MLIPRKEQCYDNIRVSKNAWDSNIVKVGRASLGSCEHCSYRWLGKLSVPLGQLGILRRRSIRCYTTRREGQAPRTTSFVSGAHCCGLGYRLVCQLRPWARNTCGLTDFSRHPFNDSIIASGSDDGKVWSLHMCLPRTLSIDFCRHSYGKYLSSLLYKLMRTKLPISPLLQSLQVTRGIASIWYSTIPLTFSRKVGHVLFNPSAENILATSSGDYNIKLWDIEAASARLTLKHADIVQSLSWSANGGLLVTTSRDKKLRIWDVRQEKPAHVGPGHAGAKNSRAVWMGEHDRVATTGFSKMSDRQLGLWDIRNANGPMGGFDMLDSISGVCMPFWDDATQCLYLAGKG